MERNDTKDGHSSLFVNMRNESAVAKFKEMNVHQEPINGIVQPPVIPPDGKDCRNTNSLEYILKQVLYIMMRHKTAFYFKEPVDAVSYNIPDYHSIIRYPMDLNTIKQRIVNCYYYDAKECIMDFQMIFYNCYWYNKPDQIVVQAAQTLENLFVKRMKNIPKEEFEIPMDVKRKNGTSMIHANDAVPGCSKDSTGSAHNFQNQSEYDNSIILNKISNPATLCHSSKVKRSVKRKGDSLLDTPYVDGVSSASPLYKTPKLSIPLSPPVKKIFQESSSFMETNSATLRIMDVQMNYCRFILTQLFSKRHFNHASLFYKPVDARSSHCSDYYHAIKKPMDLSTVKSKLESGIYESPSAFASDVRLIFSNCYKYYFPKDKVKTNAARTLQGVFEIMYAKMPDEPQPLQTVSLNTEHKKKLSLSSSSGYSGKENSETDSEISLLEQQAHEALKLSEELSKTFEKRKSKCDIRDPSDVEDEIDIQSITPPVNGEQSKISIADKAFTKQHEDTTRYISVNEKHQLQIQRADISKLSGQKFSNALNFITEREPSLQQSNEIEIDFDKLKSSTFRELQAYVASSSGNSQKPNDFQMSHVDVAERTITQLIENGEKDGDSSSDDTGTKGNSNEKEHSNNDSSSSSSSSSSGSSDSSSSSSSSKSCSCSGSCSSNSSGSSNCSNNNSSSSSGDIDLEKEMPVQQFPVKLSNNCQQQSPTSSNGTVAPIKESTGHCEKISDETLSKPVIQSTNCLLQPNAFTPIAFDKKKVENYKSKPSGIFSMSWIQSNNSLPLSSTSTPISPGMKDVRDFKPNSPGTLSVTQSNNSTLLQPSTSTVIVSTKKEVSSCTQGTPSVTESSNNSLLQPNTSTPIVSTKKDDSSCKPKTPGVLSMPLIVENNSLLQPSTSTPIAPKKKATNFKPTSPGNLSMPLILGVNNPAHQTAPSPIAHAKKNVGNINQKSPGNLSMTLIQSNTSLLQSSVPSTIGSFKKDIGDCKPKLPGNLSMTLIQSNSSISQSSTSSSIAPIIKKPKLTGLSTDAVSVVIPSTNNEQNLKLTQLSTFSFTNNEVKELNSPELSIVPSTHIEKELQTPETSKLTVKKTSDRNGVSINSCSTSSPSNSRLSNTFAEYKRRAVAQKLLHAKILQQQDKRKHEKEQAEKEAFQKEKEHRELNEGKAFEQVKMFQMQFMQYSAKLGRPVNSTTSRTPGGVWLSNGVAVGTRLCNGVVAGAKLSNGVDNGKSICSTELVAGTLSKGAVAGTHLSNDTVAGTCLSNDTVAGTCLSNDTVAGTLLSNDTVAETHLSAEAPETKVSIRTQQYRVANTSDNCLLPTTLPPGRAELRRLEQEKRRNCVRTSGINSNWYHQKDVMNAFEHQYLPGLIRLDEIPV